MVPNVSTGRQGMRVSMERLDRTWIDGLFWLAFGVEDTILAPLMKYLYRRTTVGRTNTMLSKVYASDAVSIKLPYNERLQTAASTAFSAKKASFYSFRGNRGGSLAVVLLTQRRAYDFVLVRCWFSDIISKLPILP